MESATRSLRRDGRVAVGGLHAVDVPARQLRSGDNEENATLPDLSARERFTLWPAVAMVIFMGIFPMVFLKPMEPAVARLVEQVRRNEGQTVRLVQPRAQSPEPKAR
jgi:hypothetical protein